MTSKGRKILHEIIASQIYTDRKVSKSKCVVRVVSPDGIAPLSCLQHVDNWIRVPYNIDGLVQDCSNSSANALDLLQSCTEPSMYAGSTL